MPRPKCPQCGFPLDGSFLGAKCQYCGAKLAPSARAWRDLILSLLPVAIFAGVMVLAGGRHLFTSSNSILLAYEAIIVCIVILLRYLPAPTHRARILELLKPAPRENATIRYQPPLKPSFDTPKNWQPMLSAARPRKLQSPLTKIVSGYLALAALALAVWAPVWMAREHDRRDMWPGYILAGFATVAIVLGAIQWPRELHRSRRILREGEVTVGWIADVWETGARHRRVHVTVGFRDSVGRNFERDFQVLRFDDPIDQGRPVLVFYDPLDPTQCVTPCASSIELAEQIPLSAVRVG